LTKNILLATTFDTTPPRLRTGESSIHLVRFWPSPTLLASRDHQLWASTVRWWVGTVRPFLCMCREGVDLFPFPCKTTPSILATFDTTPSPHGRINAPRSLLTFAHIHAEAGTPALGTFPHGRINAPLVCFWHSPTSLASRDQQLWASAVQWWVGTVRSFLCMCREGVDLFPHTFKKRPHLFLLHWTPPGLNLGNTPFRPLDDRTTGH
jgi:hypothetical protein